MRTWEPDEQAEVAELLAEVEPAVRQAIRESREETGWTQARLAEEVSALGVDLDKTAITRIETGQRGIKLDEAWAFAACLRFQLENVLPAWSGDLALRVEMAQRRLDSARKAQQVVTAEVQEAQADLRRLKARVRKAQR